MNGQVLLGALVAMAAGAMALYVAQTHECREQQTWWDAYGRWKAAAIGDNPAHIAPRGVNNAKWVCEVLGYEYR